MFSFLLNSGGFGLNSNCCLNSSDSGHSAKIRGILGGGQAKLNATVSSILIKSAALGRKIYWICVHSGRNGLFSQQKLPFLLSPQPCPSNGHVTAEVHFWNNRKHSPERWCR